MFSDERFADIASLDLEHPARAPEVAVLRAVRAGLAGAPDDLDGGSTIGDELL
jgi:hypothetical protein